MTTARDIINQAVGDYLNEWQEGSDSLPAWKAERALARLNALLASFPSQGIGGGYREKVYTSSFEVVEPIRVYCQGGTFTITLPQEAQDGYSVDIKQPGTVTLARNGHSINGSFADATVPKDTEFVFIEGDWKPLETYTLNSVIPWPDEFDGALAAMLAVEVSGTFGLEEATPSSIQAARRGWAQMRARFNPRLRKRSDYGVDPRQRRVNILSLDN